MPWWILLFAIPVLVIAPLIIVFAVVKRSIANAAAALEPEGIEVDSGPVTVTARYYNFRTPRFYSGGGIRRNPARIVLTKQRLHILQRPQRYGIIDRDKLSHFKVSVEGDLLRLESSDPPEASGTVSFTVRVPDANRWRSALAACGAKAA